MWQVCRYCGRQHWSPPAQLLGFFNQNLIDKLERSNTDEYILCSILWKEIDLDHKLTIIEHLQVQKIYLLDAHIFCETVRVWAKKITLKARHCSWGVISS